MPESRPGKQHSRRSLVRGRLSAILSVRQPLGYDVIPGRCASKSAVADLDNHVCRTRVNPRSDIEPGISRFRDAQLRICGLVLEPVIGPRIARTRWHHPGMTAAVTGERSRYPAAAK